MITAVLATIPNDSKERRETLLDLQARPVLDVIFSIMPIIGKLEHYKYKELTCTNHAKGLLNENEY